MVRRFCSNGKFWPFKEVRIQPSFLERQPLRWWTFGGGSELHGWPRNVDSFCCRAMLISMMVRYSYPDCMLGSKPAVNLDTMMQSFLEL